MICSALFGLSLLIGALPAASTTPVPSNEPGRLNVLFIAVDDWRPQGGCYGDPMVRTPNIDRIAKAGLVFRRAYCQQAVCSPSRTSLLTGLRPDTTKVYDLETHFRDTIPQAITLPQHFKNNGYHTQGLSKIFHGGLDDPKSWSAPHWTPPGPGVGPESQRILDRLRAEAKAAGKDLRKRANQPRGPAFEAPDVPDDALSDGQTAAHAIELLSTLKDQPAPFFLAVGFLKPHLPFVSPKRYWDLYDHNTIPLAPNPFAPKDSPSFALSNSGELRAYLDIPKQGPIPDAQARNLVHGYYAATSFMDAQVGKLLDALETLKLADKTIVIIWGDHGWKLGDHGEWCKHTNYEKDANAPLVISVPGQKSAGQSTIALVEFVDIYPSLAQICGLPAPEGLQGTSFAPLLDDPKRPWKSAAFGQYPRNIPSQGGGMGYAMRTDRYRFVEWSVPGKDFRAYELYDHQADPQENVNLAGDEKNAALIKELSEKLHNGWQAALPPGH